MTRIATFFILLLSVLGVTAQEPGGSPSPSSDVFWVHDPGAVYHLAPAPRTIGSMVDAVVKAATGKSSIAAAWGSLVKPGERVGIKVMTTGGPVLNSHPEVVLAILDGLAAAGVARKNVIIWDRSASGLARAGFTPKRMGCRVVAAEGTWDAKNFHTSHISGRLIWGDHKFKPTFGAFSSGEINPDDYSSSSHFTTILTEQVDKIINVPLLASSRQCGLAGALFNMTVPNVDNWRRFTGRPGFGNPDIAMMYASEHIRERVVISIMDGLIAQYAGGPEFEPNYAFEQKTIYASTDPVALDLVALDQVERWRASAKVPPLGQMGGHVKSAGEIGLGARSLKSVRLRQVRR